jgi:hypothetical protein
MTGSSSSLALLLLLLAAAANGEAASTDTDSYVLPAPIEPWLDGGGGLLADLLVAAGEISLALSIRLWQACTSS